MPGGTWSHCVFLAGLLNVVSAWVLPWYSSVTQQTSALSPHFAPPSFLPILVDGDSILSVTRTEVLGGINEEFIVALSGSFDVVVDDGQEKKTFSLNRSYYGLYVPNGIWREMNNFSTNAVALVLDSTVYDSNDYIYHYDEYIKKHQL